MHIGIVADDLTGAADSVAPFAAAGYRAEVRFFKRALQTDAEKSDALALDTGSRDAAIKDTLRDLNFRRAARALAACNPVLIYKKIDSTLRGHLRVELEAMRHVLPEKLPVVCSAFPANGRVIENGTLRVHGEPQNRTIQEAFDYSEGEAAHTLTLAQLRQGTEAVAELLKDLQEQNISCVFCDAETDADLDILAQAILRRPDAYLPVGSAGLAAAFARQLPPKADNAAAITELLEVFKTGRVLIAVGSLHPVSRAQLRHFSERTGVPPIIADTAESWDTFCDKVHLPLDKGKRFSLIATLESAVGKGEYRGLGIRLLMFHKMWDGVWIREKEIPFDALFVTGGDSAKDAMISLNGGGLQIVGEIQAGIVLGRMITNEAASQIFQGFPILLKSGGFGTLDIMETLLGWD